MGTWLKSGCALFALAAVLFVPSRMVHYNACCHAQPGEIPGVTCCGQPKLDPHQANLSERRPCCDPFVFEATKLEIASQPTLPTASASGHDFATNGVHEPAPRWVTAPAHEVLPNLSPTGPPSTDPPLYVLHDSFII